MTGTILFIVLAFALAGCAAEARKEKLDLYWPLPPDPPRIRYVRSISDAKEVEPPKGFFKKAMSYFFGEEETPRLIRPYGLFIAGEEHLFVTDMDLQVVHDFDFPGKKYRQVFKLPGDRLRSPVGVVQDAAGHLYVTDSELKRVFEFGPDGRLVRDWPGPFSRPTGMAIDRGKQVIYLVDTGEHRVIAFNLKGEKLFDFGGRGSGAGEFNYPTHIAVHPVTGEIYVADSMNFRIERFSPEGRFISAFGSAGSLLGSFSKLKGLSVDANGIIYVVDSLYDTVEMFNDKGEFLMNFGKSGNHEGEFWLPGDIAVDQNRIYVADSYNKRVEEFELVNPSEPYGAIR